MSADLLRRAAEAERKEWAHETSHPHWGNAAAIHVAVADVLDAIADRADEVADTLTPNSAVREPIMNGLLAFTEAVALAKAILGGES